MTITLTSHDQRLRESIVRHLEWAPEVDASMIGVAAADGVVTLSGYVNTYAEKLAAVNAARRVYGVKAVADELDVRLSVERADPDLAKDAAFALQQRVDVPLTVEVTVRDGVITLTGAVQWMYQKVAAERAVKYLKGVRGVFNNITLKPSVLPKDVERRIIEGLHRHADLDARGIHVEVDGSRVTLAGSVRSHIERREAERAAWTVRGVTLVKNELSVVP